METIMRTTTLLPARTLKPTLWLIAIFLSVPVLAQDRCLIAHYCFEGNGADCSGHQTDGTVYGPVLCEDRNGSSKSAYSFDGGNGA
jgi:hypothetical protein